MLISLLLSVLGAHAAEDARSALARLSSDSGAERVDAERWLAANLTPADLPLVAEAATSGAIEVRARLIHALGNDQRHFELAVLLTLDREPVVRRMGREAVEIMAAQWFGASELTPLTDASLEHELRGHFVGRFGLRPAEHELNDLVDLLARTAPMVRGGVHEGGELALAVDPLLYAEPPDAELRPQANAGGDVVSGSFDAVLFAALDGRFVRLQGFGFDGPHPWMCVVHAPDAAPINGVELLLRWCRDMLDYADRPRGVGAARALAACGWPAVISWLERRWVDAHDRNALAGLLLAASRGRVAGALCSEAAIAQLVELADPAVEGALRPSDVAAALARLPSIGRDGADLSKVVLAGWSRANEEGRVLRAQIVSGMRRADTAWRGAVQAELTRIPMELGPRTRLAYVRALAATAGSSAAPARWSLAADEATLVRVLRDRARAPFLAWTQRIGARPPEAWRDAAAVARLQRTARALVIAWWSVEDADLETAARLAHAWLAAGEPVLELGDALAARVRVGERARIERLCARATELADARTRGASEHLALFAGVLGREARETLLGGLLDAQSSDAGSLAAIGAALGSGVGGQLADRAIQTLAGSARRSGEPSNDLGAPWIGACERAVAGLRARGEFEETQRLLDALTASLRGRDEHPLRKALRDGTWPPFPGAEPLGLEASDVLWPR